MGYTRESWFHRAIEPKPPIPKNMRLYFQQRNPRRWARLQRDLAYFERIAPKVGMIPEDVRWLL